MRYTIFCGLFFFSLLQVSLARADNIPFDSALARATSGDARSADAAIAELRAGGQETLDRLLAMRDKLLASEIDADREAASRLAAVIDGVGGQRYCTASRLFWHTDLEAAKTAARTSGKPILSLRMMGNLTDEFSCANSRFFRTSLYANREISEYLRSHFVLHWKSVRPVPKVTIDFGDGRKLERTLTGNSIHYILAADGQPIDALPGLYGPAAFAERLKTTEAAALVYAQLDAAKRPALLAGYHEQGLRSIGRAWQADLKKLGVGVTPLEALTRLSNAAPADAPQAEQRQAAAAPDPAPRAERAAELARPKNDIERPLLRAVVSITSLEKSTDDALWERIAALHEPQARLDEASVRLIRSQNPAAALAGAIAVTKSVVEDPLVKLVASFQRSIALDTVRNEYLLHSKLHQWFINGTADPDVEKLNDRVYAELFLTPRTDPWIGLAPADVYTALENGGVVRPGGSK